MKNMVQGIWSGMIGGTLIQTLILIYVTFRTDWNKEVINDSITFYLSYYWKVIGEINNIIKRNK